MKNLLLFLSICFIFNIKAQEKRTIGFYNLENFFDTIDGPNDDAEFLPDGKNAWNGAKYESKITKINQVIDTLGNPILMGFCELENKLVLEDLFNASPSRKDYGIVHKESPDLRGIDVAIAYDKKVLSYISAGIIRFKLYNVENPNTRDILWGKFVHGKDTLVAIVNHWPSRSGGQFASESRRTQAAREAKKFIDSLMRASPKTRIVFMGDLNDYPDNLAPKMISNVLIPQITKASGKFGGTYNYRGEWDVLDHIMVSENFCKGRKFKMEKKSGKIHSPDFIITEYKGDLVPKRNYGSSKHLDGYSDHLPVTIGVIYK